MNIDIEIAIMIQRIGNLFNKKIAQLSKERGITARQSFALIMLFESEDKSLLLKQIEKRFSVAQPTAYGIVKRLKEKGFVDAGLCDSNGKSTVVTLTEKGIEAAIYMKSKLAQNDEMIFLKFDDIEKDILKKLLKKAYNSAKE